MLQIYCGDGKGKTTAALGLALRAAGAGMRVHIVQLMKGRPTSELTALSKIPEITVSRLDRDYGFPANMSTDDKAAVTERHNGMLREAAELLPAIDILLLDEFNSAYRHGLLDRELADALVLGNTCAAELVLTGRRPAEKFLDAADYISEINAVRHPFTKGTTARRGIEY